MFTARSKCNRKGIVPVPETRTRTQTTGMFRHVHVTFPTWHYVIRVGVAVDRFNLPNHKRPEQKMMVVIPEVSCGAISESRQVSMSKSNFAPQTGPSKRTRARAWDRLGLWCYNISRHYRCYHALLHHPQSCTILFADHFHSSHIRFYYTVLHCLLPLSRPHRMWVSCHHRLCASGNTSVGTTLFLY